MDVTPFDIPDSLVDTVQGAARLAILTGAGVSAESGVPTFRDAQDSLWENHKPEELASPEGFLANPKLVWEWYAWRRQKALSVQPNAAHKALAELELRAPDCTLITQNIDGLHQRAGSRNLVELHGNITRVKCFDDGGVVEEWAETGEVPPRCPRCHGMLRPDVVWFGEMLPDGAYEQALHAAVSCDVFLAIGTSSVVYPAAELPLEALKRGIKVIEINLHETDLSPQATWSLRGQAGTILPALLARF